MDQASASPEASCAHNPVAPRTSSSCSRSVDRSRTGGPPHARSGPQCEPHAAPSNRDSRPSSPAPCRLKAKGYLLPEFYSGATGRSGRFNEGLLLRRLQPSLCGLLLARACPALWRETRQTTCADCTPPPRRKSERPRLRRTGRYGMCSCADHSGLMLAARITLAHLSVSSAMCLPKSAGESTSTSPPRSVSRAFILGSARAALIPL